MSRETEKHDPLLEEVAEALRPIRDEMDNRADQEDYAMFALAAKASAHPDEPEKFGVQTFLTINGPYDVIAEALYGELRELVEMGQPQIFYVIRDVIRDIEEDLNISDTGEEYLDEEGNGPTLH